MIRSLPENLAGWGRFPVEECRTFRPEKLRDLSDLLPRTESLVARGLGRSYGDAALNPAAVALMERLDHFISFDAESGVVECEGGTSFADIIELFLPRGWFLPVSPGTKFVTVGGAIACDVHGKNHHRVGTFSEFVESFELLLASGEVLFCSRHENTEIFWATVGGMGLTGIILRARFRLKRVQSAQVDVEYERVSHLDEALERFRTDEKYEYSVAWIDCLASGSALGRSVLMRGNTAQSTFGSSTSLLGESKGSTFRKRGASVPFDFPGFALNPLSIKAFNTLYYAAHPSRRALVDFETFFYPLDAVGSWNRIYGSRGFVQYQVVLPFESSREALRELLKRISGSRHASFLAVLKTFGEQNLAPLSFPFRGHTLALDIPMSDRLPQFIRELDAITLDHKGRVYLAKDALLSVADFRKMYPRFEEWLKIKQRLDPETKFASSLSRRLEIA